MGRIICFYFFDLYPHPLDLSLTKLAAIIGLDLVIALILARSFREFYIILTMLPLCVGTFYVGVVRGIILKLFN